MKLIYSSILGALLMSVICAAHPSTDPKLQPDFLKEPPEVNFDDVTGKSLGMLLDNLDVVQRREFLQFMRKLWHSRVMKGNTSPTDNIPPDWNDVPVNKEALYDTNLDKRSKDKERYSYFKCYFNPVTCYRK